MKILHVTPYFFPAWSYGGTPRAVFEIAKRQTQAGHIVDVLTSDTYDKNSRLKHFEVIDNINIYRTKNVSNFITWKFHFVNSFSLPIEVLNANYDVIHLHEVRTILNLQVLTKIKAKKYIISPWGTLPYNSNLISIKKIFDLLLLPLLQKKINVSLAQTLHEKKILSDYKIGKEKTILPLGVDKDFFKSIPSKKESRKKLGISEKNTYIFAYLGRFSFAKGLNVLISASKLLKNKTKSEFLLLISGRDDGFLGTMKKMISSDRLEKYVKIIPPLYDKDRLLLYSAADCFISLPTEYEETSTTCLEALAVGTPVITSYCAEIPLLSRENFIKHVNSNALDASNAMLESIKENHIVDRNKVLNTFDWNKITLQLTRIYES